MHYLVYLKRKSRKGSCCRLREVQGMFLLVSSIPDVPAGETMVLPCPGGLVRSVRADLRYLESLLKYPNTKLGKPIVEFPGTFCDLVE